MDDGPPGPILPPGSLLERAGSLRVSRPSKAFHAGKLGSSTYVARGRRAVRSVSKCRPIASARVTQGRRCLPRTAPTPMSGRLACWRTHRLELRHVHLPGRGQEAHNHCMNGVRRWAGPVLGAIGLLAAGIVAVGLLAIGPLREDEEPPEVTLQRPAPGEARADHLADGTPVWVIGHEDGSVTVLSGFDTHMPAGVRKLLWWCPGARTLEDPRHGSRYDESGAKVAGPAPAPLHSWQTAARAAGWSSGTRSQRRRSRRVSRPACTVSGRKRSASTSSPTGTSGSRREQPSTPARAAGSSPTDGWCRSRTGPSGCARWTVATTRYRQTGSGHPTPMSWRWIPGPTRANSRGHAMAGSSTWPRSSAARTFARTADGGPPSAACALVARARGLVPRDHHMPLDTPPIVIYRDAT
jgi:hypothetical protein